MIAEIYVSGIHCTGCTGRIERVLAKREGISSVSGNASTKVVTVDYDPSILTEADIKSAIAKIGFEL